MTHIRKALGVVALLLTVGYPTLLHAQTALTSTTLSAAVANATAQTMVIASATGFTASTATNERFAVVDREVVKIMAISSTTLTIQRGRAPGLAATGHRSGALVYFIPNDVMLARDDKAGLCSVAGGLEPQQNATFHPVLNVMNGRAFYCYNGVWTAGPWMGLGQRTCTVTQATSKSTAVTCQGLSGAITMNGAALAAAAEVGFTVTDASVQIGDVVALSIRSGGTVDSYQATVDTVAAGSFRISVSNASAGSLSEAVIVNFAVIKTL